MFVSVCVCVHASTWVYTRVCAVCVDWHLGGESKQPQLYGVCCRQRDSCHTLRRLRLCMTVSHRGFPETSP